jgi:hypothetical protein
VAWQSIAAGEMHSLYVKDVALQAMGSNHLGRLGLENTVAWKNPPQTGAGSKYDVWDFGLALSGNWSFYGLSSQVAKEICNMNPSNRNKTIKTTG